MASSLSAAESNSQHSHRSKLFNYISSVETWVSSLSFLIDQICFEADMDDDIPHRILETITNDAKKVLESFGNLSNPSTSSTVSASRFALSLSSQLSLISSATISLSTILKGIEFHDESDSKSDPSNYCRSGGSGNGTDAVMNDNDAFTSSRTLKNGDHRLDMSDIIYNNNNSSSNSISISSNNNVNNNIDSQSLIGDRFSTTSSMISSSSPRVLSESHIRAERGSKSASTRLVGWGKLPQANGKVYLRPALIDNRNDIGYVNNEVRIKVKQIACCGGRGLYISSTDDIYSFGEADFDENDKSSEHSGNSRWIPGQPRVIQEMVLERVLAGRRVVSVSCGHHHSVAVTVRGEVWTWGRGTYGCLGHGDTIDQPTPRVVVALLDRHVREVACGGAHTVAVASPSVLFAWGLGRHGRLGTGDSKDRLVPTIIDLNQLHPSSKDSPEQKDRKYPSWFPKSSHTEQIIKISCGWAFTVVLGSNGTVRAFGAGKDCQCGVHPANDQEYPVIVRGFRGTQIIDISCGYHHTLALGKDGSVWSWGMGEQGQLGQGPRVQSSPIPKPVQLPGKGQLSTFDELESKNQLFGALPPLLSDRASDQGSASSRHKKGTENEMGAVCVQAGQFHSVCVMKNGYLLSWGSNKSGELGCGTTMDSTVPIKVSELPLQGSIEQVVAGSHFTMVLLSRKTDNGLSISGDMLIRAGLIPKVHGGPVLFWRKAQASLLFGRKEYYAWRPRYALLTESRLELFKNPEDKSADMTLIITPQIKVIIPERQTRSSRSAESEERRSPSIFEIWRAVDNTEWEAQDDLFESLPNHHQPSEYVLLARIEAPNSVECKKWVSILKQFIQMSNYSENENEKGSENKFSNLQNGFGNESNEIAREEVKRADGNLKIWRERIIPAIEASYLRSDVWKPSTLLPVSVKDLLSNGIPPSLRGRVWPLAIGNALKVTPELYEIYFERSKMQKQRMEESIQRRSMSHSQSAPSPIQLQSSPQLTPTNDDSGKSFYTSTDLNDSIPKISNASSSAAISSETQQASMWNRGPSGTSYVAESPTLLGIIRQSENINLVSSSLSQNDQENGRSSSHDPHEGAFQGIGVDLPRTLPKLSLFGKKGDPFYMQLREVLEVFACYRPDIGYVQGMSYLAANICLYIQGSFECFSCLANLLTYQHLFDFFRVSQAYDRIEQYYTIIDSILKKNDPTLYMYLESKVFIINDLHIIYFQWLQTLFLRRLPLDLATRIIDCFLLVDNGSLFVMKVVVAILKLLRPIIMQADHDEIMMLLNAPLVDSRWVKHIYPQSADIMTPNDNSGDKATQSSSISSLSKQDTLLLKTVESIEVPSLALKSLESLLHLS